MEKKRILIADDEEDVLSIVEELLKESLGEEYSIETLLKPKEPLRDGSEYSVVISDIDMNPVNGFGLVINIPSEKVILMTGRPQEYRERVKKMGYGFSEKPFKIENLYSLIKERLNDKIYE